jgi:hypothetical protein
MIRALTVIGHGEQILPHFLTHYSEHVDEIQLVVYESDLNHNLFADVLKIVENFPKAKIIKRVYERAFDWEKVTSLYNEIKNNHPNDWWVVADIDEFHLYPDNHLKGLIRECENEGWDLVRGGFIDRIGPDGEFSEITSSVDIFKQFPNAGFFRYPMSKACPNKICVMRGYVELTSGQHYAKINNFTTWGFQGWSHPLIHSKSFVQVHHFKWDSTSIERIKAVANVRQFYSHSYEYKIMYENLEKTNFKIDLTNPEFMFENSDGRADFRKYKQWNKLIKKIMLI